METQTQQAHSVQGGFVKVDGEDFYEILNYDRMPPFLMSIVSANDHWMYLSSTGGLTAGRVCAENCLFPYETADRLHVSSTHTGPLTMLRVHDEGSQLSIWHPFADSLAGEVTGTRRLLKHVVGDQVIFEEEHEQFGLVFRYRWQTCVKYGFVRTASIENVGAEVVEFDLLDGLQNLMPSGVQLGTNQRASCLVDAYKHSEIDPQSGMGIFSMTAQILDRAEAAEVLQATTVWCEGLEDYTLALSPEVPLAFARGEEIKAERICTGQRGNFYLATSMTLQPGESVSWSLVADVARSHCKLSEVRQELLDEAPMRSLVQSSLQTDHQDLVQNVASADGLQLTGTQLSSAHHFANVLFNNLRGGVSAENYWVESCDFLDFVHARNRNVAQSEQSFLRGLPERIEYPELLAVAKAQSNTDLTRLTCEYLPLTFGRRHGDPSRPWNAFEIKVRKDDGSKIYNYQGNWRDIFQNWEALAQSFPIYLPSMVAKFLNATTIDGFNPYRITRDGIDWETPDPEDPWSNIGYWGDHQIIYLSKLLKALTDYFPNELSSLFEEPMFCYAHVPYRIRSYEEIVANSSETIDFDQFTAREIQRRVEELGADGKLVTDGQGRVYYANIVEKLLVPVLSKISNFVIDGGIWLNTQRPEWNDANNALVGSGLSMVTVCYLRRHLKFLVDTLKHLGDRRYSVSVEVEQWFRKIRQVLQTNRSLLNQPEVPDEDRGRILGELGRAFSDYRLKVYEDGFSGKHTIGGNELVEFFDLAVDYFDHAIRANRRSDGLYHAYNLLEFGESKAPAVVSHLYEMLEGQVAALSSGALDLGQAAELVQSMFDSQLYRADQKSFMLYPQRDLAGFLQRNVIPESSVQKVPLLRELIEAGNQSLIAEDSAGTFRFHHSLQRKAELDAQLNRLEQSDHWSQLVVDNRQQVVDLFEDVFLHKTYTGRSGTMYGYEGLGCIYWHMVSKLLLAVQENALSAVDQKSKVMADALADSYYLVRGGLSSDKSPLEYGAFPTDPYSHTTRHSGAQQPGMTGQVKEEILTRQGELGIRIRNGEIHITPFLLRRREFLNSASQFEYFDISGETGTLKVPANALAFTVCQVPFLYQLSSGPFSMEVFFDDGTTTSITEGFLNQELSRKLFYRTGEIVKVAANIPDASVSFA